MKVNEFLKNFLNPQGQIKNKDLKKIVPELKSIIEQKTKDKKIRRDDLIKILHDSLLELGWDKEQISELSKTKKTQDSNQNTSPSFQNYKPDGGRVTELKKGKFFQGGSPGLGKKK